MCITKALYFLAKMKKSKYERFYAYPQNIVFLSRNEEFDEIMLN